MVVKDTVTVTIEKRGFNVVLTVTTQKHDSVVTNLQVEAKRALVDDKFNEPREQTVYDSKSGTWPKTDDPAVG